MQFLPPAIPSTWARLSSRPSLPRARPLRPPRPRHYSSVSSGALNRHKSDKEHEYTFEQLRIQPSVLAALRLAFPSVKQPTSIQYRFIDTISKRQDVLLRDRTGTGKSFALALALLNKKRGLSYRDQASGSLKTSITSLLLVPHRDLAYQFYHWFERINQHMPRPGSMQSLAQVLVRGAQPLEEHIATIQKIPPHILIATPQVVLDAVNADQHALPLDHLSTVVVDEVDYLIECAPVIADKYKMMKVERQLNRHPGPTRLLLNQIYSMENVRRKASYQMYRKTGVRGGDHRRVSAGAPQLVMMSATLRNNLKRFLLADSGWFTQEPGMVQRITGDASAHYPTGLLQNTGEEDKAEYSVGGTSLQHHILVVSEGGGITNMNSSSRDTPASEAESAVSKAATGTSSSTLDGMQSPPLSTLPEYADMEEINEPSPFDPSAIEAIATAFALDVPSVALLVLRSDAPVQRAVYDLQRIGVNARPLDVVKDENGKTHLMRREFETTAENPTLLVSTLASTRGLDLPELSHVFVLGLLDDGAVDSYMHIAGRVGRFGRGGKVISVVADRHEVLMENGKRKTRDEPRMMGTMLKKMGIRPTKLEHFS